MPSQSSTQVTKKKGGCGCAQIPFSVILLVLGGGYWWFFHLGNANALLAKVSANPWVSRGQELIATVQGKKAPNQTQNTPSHTSSNPLANPVAGEPRFVPPVPNLHAPVAKDRATPTAPAAPSATAPTTQPPQPNLTAPGNSAATSEPIPTTSAPKATASSERASAIPAPAPAPPSSVASSSETAATPILQSSKPWKQDKLRGIYLSRYHITNNTSETTIRERVRYYKSQGINTIIHGVWGNGCTMYNSEVMQKTLGFESCPNLFKEDWLDWLIDEAHKQGMEVHAYFEKGIKLDEDSPIFDLAAKKRWIVPGVDRTYARVDHYVLDVEVPEVATFFKAIVTEFVQRYPEIDAVQWDDYLGYHAELPGQVDRTENLTRFLQSMIADMRQANPNVSFDICHHNPYWAKRYFAADWESWDIDRAFIQVYNDSNFEEELGYVRQHNGIAIADNQMHRLKQVIDDPTIESVLIFPVTLKPEQAAAQVQKTLTN